MLPYIAAGLYRCEQLKNLSAIFKQDLAPQPLKTFKCQSHGLIQLWRLKVIELDWAHLWSTMVCPGHQWTVASLHLPGKSWERIDTALEQGLSVSVCVRWKQEMYIPLMVNIGKP